MSTSATSVRTSSPAARTEWDARSPSGSPGTATSSSSTPARPPSAGSADRSGSPRVAAMRATRSVRRRGRRRAADLAPLRRLGQQRRRLPRRRPAQRPGRGSRRPGAGQPAARRDRVRGRRTGLPRRRHARGDRQRVVAPGAARRPRRPRVRHGEGSVEGLTRAVAVDYAPSGIRCNAVALGSIATAAVRRDARRAARGRRRAGPSAPARPTRTSRRGRGRGRVPCCRTPLPSSPGPSLPVDGGRAALGVDPEPATSYERRQRQIV